MADLSSRSTLPEKMDDPFISRKDLEKALSELETVNTFLGGYTVILNALNKVSIKENDRIIDIGCGGGDVLRKMADWAKKKNRNIQLTGIDINPQTVEFARRKSLEYPTLRFKVLNVWEMNRSNAEADIVINNLFCHHFEDDKLVDLIRIMYQVSSRHVIINDLHRHWFAYYAIKYITSVFSGSYLVKYDGPLSVARALTKTEWERILNRAGLNNYKIKWMWAWRWQIIISKNK